MSAPTLEDAPAGLGVRRGDSALVTGASSGIGETFARTLAARGVSVFLSARPQEADRLAEIVDELASAHGVRCVGAAADLSDPAGADTLIAAVSEHGFEPDLLVNSAGVGSSGRFRELSIESQVRTIDVNVTGLVRLTHAYLPRMAARRSGGVINLVSTAAFQPMPYFGVYTASKAFVLNFSLGLWAEGHPEGVRVLAVCSGPVETAFHGAAGESDSSGARGFLRRRYLTPQQVVDESLLGLVRDRPMIILRVSGLGRLYKPVTAVTHALPASLRLRLAERVGRRLFEVDGSS